MKHYSTPKVAIVQLAPDVVRTSVQTTTRGENFGFDFLD